MNYVTRIYEAFKDEPEKAKVLGELAEEFELTLKNIRDIVTRPDLEKTQLELEAKIDITKKELETQIIQNRQELEAKIDITKKELETQIIQNRQELEAKILEVKSSILKWSFVFWFTQFFAIMGVLLTVLKIAFF